MDTPFLILQTVQPNAAIDPMISLAAELLRQGPLGIILAWFMLRLERKLEEQRATDEKLADTMAELSKTVLLNSELIRSLVQERRA